MAQTVTDQHESGIAVRRGTHHTGTAAELPAEPLNDIVGPDVDPVLKEKIAVGQGFLNSILPTFLAASFSFIARSSATTAFAFSWVAFLFS